MDRERCCGADGELALQVALVVLSAVLTVLAWTAFVGFAPLGG